LDSDFFGHDQLVTSHTAIQECLVLAAQLLGCQRAILLAQLPAVTGANCRQLGSGGSRNTGVIENIATIVWQEIAQELRLILGTGRSRPGVADEVVVET
jgi:hypothetical protein